MYLNAFSPAEGSRKDRKRVGRGIGSGCGKTCGRGHKGKKSRSGGNMSPGFEGGQQPYQRRLPKFGFTSRISRITAEVRLSELNRVDGDVISLETLKECKIISSDMQFAKVVLSGDVNKAFTIEKSVRLTKGARAAIEAAGGKITE